MIRKLFVVVSSIILIIISIYFMQDSFSFSRNIILSRENMNRVDLIASKKNVIGVQVVQINLAENTRKLVYVKYSDSDLIKLHNAFMKNNITIEIPVFTRDEVNNNRIIRIINHEFVCSPFKETMSYKYAPSAAAKVSTVCAMSVPPSFGAFYGIVGIFFREPPTAEEVDAIRIVLKNLSETLVSDLEP